MATLIIGLLAVGTSAVLAAVEGAESDALQGATYDAAMQNFAKAKKQQRREVKIGEREEALGRANLRETQKQLIRDQREAEEQFDAQEADIRRQETTGFLDTLRSGAIENVVASQKQAQRFLA